MTISRGNESVKAEVTLNDGSKCSSSYDQWTLGIAGILGGSCYKDATKVETAQKAAIYETPVLNADMYLNGPIQADVWITTTQTDAALAVRVDSVSPDGVATPISTGLMSARYRAVDTSRSRYVNGVMIQPWHPFTEASKQAVVPGQPMLVPVEVFPAAAIIRKGHKLRIAISASNQAQGIWAAARAADRVADFLPTLVHVIRLKRLEAECLAGGGDLYDALIDDYEPGATAESLGAMFDRMRPRLVVLREAVLAHPAPAPLVGHFSTDSQLRMSRDLATAFGYDWSRGRIDLAVHPFSSGGGSDSRITTRVVETDPFNCFYSTIHEVGHSSYELAIDPDYAMTPLGHGVSMGVHESQSRIYENQLGRSRAFTGWMFGQMRDWFGDFGITDADGFYAAVNRVQPGFIRTEADEVHYNLHIMMRFDLERALIRGDLAVTDLEAAWNDRFAADFGVAVDRPSHGMLSATTS